MPARSSCGTAASGFPLERSAEGLDKGKLLFELEGYKLRGMWTLVKLKKSEKEWLLIKERDACVRRGAEPPPESVFSGLTVEELAGRRRSGEADASGSSTRLGAPRRAVRAEAVKLMLAETRDEPFSRRRAGSSSSSSTAIACSPCARAASARLLSRNGND